MSGCCSCQYMTVNAFCVLWGCFYSYSSTFEDIKCSLFISLSHFVLYICHQLEGKMGKASVAGGEKDSPDLKGALKKEREEHQHLLADSYAAVMDLTKQLQISEKNWSRERLELLEHFNQERSQWEQHLREAQSKGTEVRCHMGVKGFVHSKIENYVVYFFLWNTFKFQGTQKHQNVVSCIL